MSDRATNDLAAMLTPPPSQGVQFSQARVLTWDNETLANTLEWRGITITDVPLVEGINALTIRPGDIVGMLGWAPQGRGGVGSWWILGKLSVPGEFVADLDVTAKLFRFVTEDGHPLAFFGKEIDGDPTWILYYGNPDGQRAVRLTNNEFIQMFDVNGNEVLSTDAQTGHGLARPYFNYPLYPDGSAEQSGSGSFSMWPSTGSSSYTPLWFGQFAIWHPEIAWAIGVSDNGGTTDVRIQINAGGTVTTVETFSSSSNGQFAVPGWGTDVRPGNQVQISVQGRNSGARVWVGVRQFEGRQS